MMKHVMIVSNHHNLPIIYDFLNLNLSVFVSSYTCIVDESQHIFTLENGSN